MRQLVSAQMQTGATISASSCTNANEDASELEKAMKGFGGLIFQTNLKDFSKLIRFL